MLKFMLILVLSLPSFLSADSLPLVTPYLRRPHVLAPKVNLLETDMLWEVRYPGRIDRDAGESRIYGINISHTRHTKIDEQIYVVWHIIPAGVGYELPVVNNGRTSAEWHLDWGTNFGLYVAPTFTGKRKWSWSEDAGAEFALQYSYIFPLNRDYSYWRFGFQTGPIYQLSSSLAIGLKINPFISNVYLAKLFTDNEDPRLGRAVTQLGVGPWLEFSMSNWVALRAEAKAIYLEYGGQSYAVSTSFDIYF
jgi:hypothetical protein